MNDRVAIVTFPAASVARTRKVYDPSASAAAVWEVDLVQDPYAGVPWSTEHWTLDVSVVNPNVGVLSFVSPDGPELIARAGGVASTEKACESLAWFPAASVTRTRNV